MNKKGLSPVVATVLLISLVLVLALIIFLWAKYFIPETIEKSGMPIKDSCNEVNFEFSYASKEVSVQNNGNIPIYGFEIGVKSGMFGSVSYSNYTGGAYVTKSGETNYITLESEVNVGEEISIVPVLLGQDIDTTEKKAYICDDSGQSLTVE